ncbi:hypothetical protein DD237_004794 [Peronospora effusa]|uniref:Uncharacterized protein n=1 Tax=Peronospora effusa TaxID=542832 RepID=A0A425CCJ7_9STRA|nr:hypothetical protein DD237_004794 [Peronospora effusa]
MDQPQTVALSTSELIARITDPSRCTDIAGMNRLNSLIKCCPSASCKDVELLKQLMSHLMSGQLQALDNDDASEFHASKWQLLTNVLRVSEAEFLASELALQSVLSLMLTDRFVSTDVLTAMAQWLVQFNSGKSSESLSACNLLDLKLTSTEQEGTFVELIKQMYVMLRNVGLRQSLAEMLEKVVSTKEQAKKVVRSGMLRVLLQVALEHPDEVVDAILLHNFDLVGTRVASLVCFEAATLELSRKKNAAKENVVLAARKRQDVCELVVTLMLSGSSLVFTDAVRMLQLLIDNEPCRALLPTIPDLRGALEKAHTLVRLKGSKLLHDEYLKELCEAQYGLLGPEIDAFERKNGSVIGLLSNDDVVLRDDDLAGEHGLELALTCKTRGNAFFRRGNYPAACAFYRRAIAVLRAAQLQVETSQQSLSIEKLLARCTIGASVQVCSHQGDKWQDAMVSDVKNNGDSSKVEVLYDASGREDEWVAISRIRLRMNTALLTAFDDLAVDCSMNMGKAFTALGDHDQAVQCFSHALALRGGKLISALYSRGVANMARRDLTAAQQDLWNANQQCRIHQNNSTSGGTSKTNVRDIEQNRVFHKQIVAAYKKLQQMHANKKRLDKKVIKQMVQYLSTIPGLQDE